MVLKPKLFGGVVVQSQTLPELIGMVLESKP